MDLCGHGCTLGDDAATGAFAGGDAAFGWVVGYPKVGLAYAGRPLAIVDEFCEGLVELVGCDPGHEWTTEAGCGHNDRRSVCTGQVSQGSNSCMP